MTGSSRSAPLVVATQDRQFLHAVEAATTPLGAAAPRVSHAESPSDCLTAVRLLEPRMVVIDDAVLEQPGAGIVNDLRRTRPDTTIVYVAAHHTQTLERDVRQAGALFYLAQPLDGSTLRSIVVAVTGKSVGHAG